MSGFVESQLRFAEKIKPKGAIKASWRAFIETQVELDDARMWGSKEEERTLVGEIPADMKPFQVRFIEGLKGIIP